MKVSFLSDKIQTKLSFLNHAVSTKSSLQVLSCFLIEAKKGEINIKATDLEIGISVSIPASVEKEGKAVIPAKNFTDLFSNLGSQKITLAKEGESLVLTGNKVRAVFQTIQEDEFPKLYDDEGEEYVSLGTEEIEKIVSRVGFSASTVETSRPALSGILIDQDKKEALIVATDSYRLSLQKNAFRTKQELRRPLVIPARTIRELAFLKEEKGVRLNISEKNNQVLFFAGDTILVGRLIEADYPEYQKIIPGEFNTKTEINREELLRAIRIASVFARETANIIKLSIEKQKIIISANSPSVGEDSVEVEAKTTGESNEIAFNAKYLLDILTAVGDEDMVFEMNGPLSPGIFRIKGDNSFLHLIMPIRVQG